MVDKHISDLVRELCDAVMSLDSEDYLSLWPEIARDYAKKTFISIAKLESNIYPIALEIKPISNGYGIIHLSTRYHKSIDLGYCSTNGKAHLIWKYAVIRKNAIAYWPKKDTKYYTVIISPKFSEDIDLSILDTATDQIMKYFSSRPIVEKGDFIILSRRDELVGSVPVLLNKCDYIDSITGDIISSTLDNFHEIAHRILLLNGFPPSALTLLLEGSADIFNPRPFEAEENIDLRSSKIRKLLDDEYFYSDIRNFSYAAKLCDGIQQLLGIETLRSLFDSSRGEFITQLERYAGCGLEAFLERIIYETKLPGKLS
jgi:hypothetical protein